MALTVMYDLPEITHQRYGALVRATNLDKRLPPDLTFHAAWEKEDGSGWQIFELWDSDEAFRTFLQEKFAPAMRGRSREFSVEILSNNVHPNNVRQILPNG